MQNTAFFFFFGGGGGIFYQCEEYACLLHIILLRARISQNVKYWYELRDIWYQFFTRCEELVPVFHGVKFAKCAVQHSSIKKSIILIIRKV